MGERLNPCVTKQNPKATDFRLKARFLKTFSNRKNRYIKKLTDFLLKSVSSFDYKASVSGSCSVRALPRP